MAVLLIYILAVVLHGLYIPLTMTPYDLNDMAIAAISLSGIAVLAWYLIKEKVNSQNVIFLCPVFFILLRAVIDFVPGYTLAEVSYLFAFFGIAILAYIAGEREMYWLLLIIGAFHMLANYFLEFSWEMYLSDKHDAYGIVKNNIVYGSCMLASVYASFYLVKTEKGMARYLAIAFIIAASISVATAESRTNRAVLAISIPVFCFMQGYKKAGVLTSVLVIILTAIKLTDAESLTHFHVRQHYWGSAMRGAGESVKSFFFGYGVGGWELNQGVAIGPHPNILYSVVSFPHNELLQIFFEYGVVGTIVFLGYAGLMVAGRFGKKEAVVGLIFVLLTTFTHTARHPYLYFVIAVLFGLSVKGGKNKLNLFNAPLKHTAFNQIAAVLVGVAFLPLFVGAYDRMRADQAVSRFKGATPYNVYVGLQTSKSLEAQYLRNIAGIGLAVRQELRGEEVAAVGAYTIKRLFEIEKMAPGYRDLNKAMGEIRNQLKLKGVNLDANMGN